MENSPPEPSLDLQRVTRADIDAMGKRERVKFVNSLPGFKSLALVGTQDRDGNPNLAIVSTVLHLGSDTPLLGMISRPAKVARHTLENIRETGIYTLNHVHASFFEAAHQTSARYPREVSEFAATGLTEHREPGIDAPFVAESRLRIALRLREELEVQCNGVLMLVGEVTQVFYPPEIREADGFLDLSGAGSLAGGGLDGYYHPQRIDRLSYAKPGREIRRLQPGVGEPS